ncbi:major capsid protein [Luteibacter aegosomatis]|uniref:major capsid protein n=1 Tax=Luteibacter aegosomatis TaxID=2911537 RepID=UPI001FF890E0|nr:major capsid protein [Luteibacter aegosomatis]UPG86851.1 major capsid protein [Luteibacter aegosomatis]
MASLDVFHQDIFSSISLTTAVEKLPFQPTGLGELNLFNPNPIRTTALAVEQRQGKLTIIPFSERGAEGKQRETEEREARYFKVPRLMTSDTITAQEIQDIRAFGTESELMQVQAEVARRLNGPTGLTSNIEFTWEYHRLAAIQGMLLNANGDVKYDWFEEFGIKRPKTIVFNLKLNADGSAVAPAKLRPQCNEIVRAMSRRSQGAFLPTTEVYALCGDDFWDQLTNHPDVTKTYYNWAAAEELRKGQAFQAMRFGGINWFNYRGSDDNATIAVKTNEVKFFPKGAPGVFDVAYAPGESFEWVNTPGKPIYVIPIPDRDRNSFWKMEVYSYPLHICTRPEVLQSGVLAE